jgi:cell division transport system permease protein
VIGLFTPPSQAERRLLPEGRSAGPMPWVIGIMVLLTVLATAAGLALAGASRDLSDSITGRLTIQLPEPNKLLRDGQVRAILSEVRSLASVKSAEALPEKDLQGLLDPWLGDVGGEDGLPMPALIDVEMTRLDARTLGELRGAVTGISQTARVDAQADWLAPLSGLMRSLSWLAVSLIGLMAIATAAVVVLAVRAALNTHGETIAIMHLLGANDSQIAGLFQRRIALDALLGGAAGLALGLMVLVLVGTRLGDLGSELLGGVSIGWAGWVLIVAIPLLATLLAGLVSRYTVKLSLGRTL